MLQTFTEDERLREQYRLNEEFLRVRRTEQAEFEMLNEKYLKATQAYLKATQAKERERLEKEAAQKDREGERIEKERLKKSSILSMKKLGIAKEEISQSLNIPLSDVETYFE